ncbi:hypothetical protein ES705_14422 [subsurface metagenome]|jgi:hypothetical protein
MSRIAYKPPTPVPIKVAIITINFELRDFEIVLTDKYKNKLTKCFSLAKEKKPQFMILPEYSYDDELFDIYSEYSTENDCIIIGGSKLCKINTEKSKCYAVCPVFLPGQPPIMVGKENPTDSEIQLSNDSITRYPFDNTRDFSYLLGEIEIRFSVFICNDFLKNYHNYFSLQKRKDIFFVPQYEMKPNLFIHCAASLSTETETYVFGVNKSKNSVDQKMLLLKSVGTGSLNSSTVNNLYSLGYRKSNYDDYFDKSIIYDIDGPVLLVLDIDLGAPSPLPHTRSRLRSRPNVIPILKMSV